MNRVNDKLNSVNVKVRKSYRRKRVVNIDIDEDHSSRYRPGIDYIMGVNGELKDPNAPAVKAGPDNNYRYQNGDTGQINKPVKRDTLEERKKQLEEELKKINEKQRKERPDAFFKGNREVDVKNSFTGNPAPVFSLIQM